MLHPLALTAFLARVTLSLRCAPGCQRLLPKDSPCLLLKRDPATASLPQILIELFGSPFMRNCEVIIGLLIGYLVAACVKTDGNRYVSADLKPSSALSGVQLSKAPDWIMACRPSPARLRMHLRHGPGLCTCSLDKQMLALSAPVSLAHVGHQRFV